MCVARQGPLSWLVPLALTLPLFVDQVTFSPVTHFSPSSLPTSFVRDGLIFCLHPLLTRNYYTAGLSPLVLIPPLFHTLLHYALSPVGTALDITTAMPLKSTRSFSGKLLKRYRSKTKSKDEPVEPVPALPTVCPPLATYGLY
jgi:hypothetical protein